MIGTRPRAYHMYRGFPIHIIIGFSQRLTIYRHHLPFRKMDDVLYPVEEARLKLLWVYPSKHAIKRIMRRNAMLKVQKRAEPRVFCFPKLFNIIPAIGSTNDRT